MTAAKELAAAIRDFVGTYAKLSLDYDPAIDDPQAQYTGPDPVSLLAAADAIERGEKPIRVWSEIGSGCYRSWNNPEVRAKHDDLLRAISDFVPKSSTPAP